jgi:glutathione-regulated potassium-efflux system ancillary protein KefG
MSTKEYENNILILFAHPALQKSRVNRHLVLSVKDIHGVTFHDLYEAYPDFHIDVKKEQQLLVDNDIIIFQHPLFWFNMPALLKEWEDLVLEHGWAYGKDGNALRGMDYLSPFVIHGTHQITEAGITVHAEDYQRIITALRDGRVDFDEARKLQRLNSALDQIIIN